MKRFQLKVSLLAASMTLLAGSAVAHDFDEAGEPICIDDDYMMADAQNAPFASAAGQDTAAEQGSRQIPRLKVTRYGLFHERGRGWLQDTEGGTGKVIKDATLTMEEQDTRRIALRRGVFFGYKHWLKLSPDQKQPTFRRIPSHPEMILPDGPKLTRSERAITRKATHGIVTSIDAYALSEEYELVEGDWTFQLWYGDQLLVEQIFRTCWPDEEALTASSG